MSDKITIKPDGSWEFHGEDSRLRRHREDHQVIGLHGQMMDKVYCMDCGADGGYSSRTAVSVHYLCDKCFEKPHPSFIPMLPDEEIRWRNGLKEID